MNPDDQTETSSLDRVIREVGDSLHPEDRALYNRTLNLLSHGKYVIHEPTEMGEDNKEPFRRILRDFVTEFKFSLPGIEDASPAAAAPASPEVP